MLDPFRPQRHNRRLPGPRQDLQDRTIDFAPRAGEDDLQHALYRREVPFRIHTPLEPEASLRGNSERAARPADRLRLEEGALYQNVGRIFRDRGMHAAHDTRDIVRHRCVADQQHLGIELVLESVERLHGLTLGGLPHDQAGPFQLAQIVGVHGAAHLQHDVVRRVDNVVDGLLANRPEPGRHPLGRGLHLHPANDHTEEAITQLRLVDADGHTPMGHFVLAALDLDVERARPRNVCQSHPGDPARSHLPRDPHVGEPVSPIRSHLDVHPDVVEAERLHQRLACRNLSGQEHDA